MHQHLSVLGESDKSRCKVQTFWCTSIALHIVCTQRIQGLQDWKNNDAIIIYVSVQQFNIVALIKCNNLATVISKLGRSSDMRDKMQSTEK